MGEIRRFEITNAIEKIWSDVSKHIDESKRRDSARMIITTFEDLDIEAIDHNQFSDLISDAALDT